MRRVAWFGFGLSLVLASTAPAAPAPLSRYFPGEDLVIYAEFDGLDNHAGLWRKSASYRLLTETPAGAMLGDLFNGLAGRALMSAPVQPMTIAEMRTVVEHLVGSGFAVGVVRRADEPNPRCVGFVVRGAARGKVHDLLEKLLDAGKNADAKSPTVDRPGGRKIVIEGGPPPQRSLAWWIEGDDLAVSVASAEGADLMIDALDGRQPAAAADPAIAALRRADDGFTPIGFAFLDAIAFKNLPPPYSAYGFDQIKRLDYRWGFQGEALMTVTRVSAPAPRRGLLAIFDQATFDRTGLPSLPPGIRGFTTFSVNATDLFDRVAAGFANMDPSNRAAFEALEKSFRTRTGQRLRDDVLIHLGPKVTVYALPTRVEAPSNVLSGLAQGLFLTPPSAVVIDVKDVAGFARVLDDAMAKVEESFKSDEASQIPPVRIHRLKGTEHGYVVSVSPIVLPLPAGTKPTVILGKTSVVIGSTPDAARGVIALQERGGTVPAGDALSGSVGRLPGEMIFVHVSDARRSLLPELIANLPMLIQWYPTTMPGFRPRFGPNGRPMPFWGQPALFQIDPDRVPTPEELRPFLFPSEFSLCSDDQGFRFTSREAFPAFNPVAMAPVAAVMLVPAFQARRAAAQRAQSTNNLKQIGLALHNYHSVNDHFPPAAITDKNGKPLLSWRVAILPFLEQQALYNEFKLDEAWDSPHNKPLMARMPAVFSIPNAVAAPGTTFYRGFSGTSTLFDSKVKEGVGLRFVTDGSSNTLGVVESKTAVSWTKPGEEIPFNSGAQPAKIQELLQSLGGHSPGGFNALFLDGSVRFIHQTINLNVFKALITRDQGEVISADAY